MRQVSGRRLRGSMGILLRLRSLVLSPSKLLFFKASKCASITIFCSFCLSQNGAN